MALGFMLPRHRIPLILLVIAALTGSFGRGPVAAADGAQPAVAAALKDLRAFASGAAGAALPARQRITLREVLDEVEAAMRQPVAAGCPELDPINRLLVLLQQARQGPATPIAEDLYNRVRRLRDLLQQLIPGCADPRQGMEPRIAILDSDNTVFHLTLAFGLPQVQTLLAGGELWTSVTVPGIEDGGIANGGPDVPAFRTLIGVPRGATAVLSFARPLVSEVIRLNLYPYQPLHDEMSTEIDSFPEELPPPELYHAQPFFKDGRLYGLNLPLPLDVCRLRPAGSSRDLQMTMLECSAGTYIPNADALVLYGSIEVQITFTGGNGSFLTQAALNPFESGPGVNTGAVLNRAALDRFVEADSRPRFCAGEELLILTHPSYHAPALTLKAWKDSKGIPTSVFNVNDGAGGGPDTKEAIDAFIDDRYNNCVVRPSYLLLLGDSDDIPTWVMHRLEKPVEDTVATDFPYGKVNTAPTANETLPDLAVGRIPVDSEAEAQTVVDKIVQYESDPPFSPAFYSGATIASYHQCCRTDVPIPGVEDGRAFITSAEYLRNQLLGRGYAVDRIYNTNLKYSPDYEEDPTPKAFANQTPLPQDLLPPFPWDGDAADITSAINAGRSLFFHIDHGGTSGWGDPPFNTGNVPSLTNGELLPVLFNLNCSSGNFEYASFSERILKRSGGGAVGVFGWTRMSNTLYYFNLLRGSLDALFPDTLPSFGNGSAKHRLGDLFNHSKIFMATQHAGLSPNDPGFPNAVNHARLYHLFGDPTTEVWTENPFRLPTDIVLIPEFDFIDVEYAVEGAVITALQQGRAGLLPIGRAPVVGGVAHLAFVNPPEPETPLMLSASVPNAVSTVLVPESGMAHKTGGRATARRLRIR
jgi:hypothetical protein